MTDEVPEIAPPVAPLGLIAAVVSYAVMIPFEGFNTFLAAPFGAIGAAVIGVPVAKVAQRFKVRAGWAAPIIGALAGWLCAVAALLLISLLSGFQAEAARDLLSGIPARYVASIGAITGIVYWSLYGRRR
jgi:hypothetical protein